MKNVIQPLKGTRDFYPEIMAARTWLYGLLRKVSESYGYQEYEGPFLESIELYAAKSGEELVKEQSYVFPDRSGDLITLRPELTPTLVRMIAQRQKQLTYPLRWWSWGPMWRYERPQKGRTREFFQWNLDLVGTNSPEADAETAAVAASFFRLAGLKPDKVTISVNNRRLMDAELVALGIPTEERSKISRFIDRRDKMRPEEWESYGSELGLTSDQMRGIRAILDNPDLWTRSEELVRFFEAAKALGASEYVRYDPGIIRGLDYYTGTVFEGLDLTGDVRRSIFGGGRYDNLMADVGGDPLPGVGFAMGDVVIMLLLESQGLLPKDTGKYTDTALVTVFDEGSLLDSYKLSCELREAGLKVSCYPEPAKLQKQFRYADKTGMRVALVLGPEEIANGQVAVKDLVSGEQVSVRRAEAAEKIRKLLDSALPS